MFQHIKNKDTRQRFSGIPLPSRKTVNSLASMASHTLLNKSTHFRISLSNERKQKCECRATIFYLNYYQTQTKSSLLNEQFLL